MTRFIVGVDLGGTNIVVGAMPEDGSRTIAVRSEPTEAQRCLLYTSPSPRD